MENGRSTARKNNKNGVMHGAIKDWEEREEWADRRDRKERVRV